MGTAVRGALPDLKLDRGRVAFDDMGAGFRLGVEGMQVADGYDPLMFARAVKTDAELRLLERSTAPQRDRHPPHHGVLAEGRHLARPQQGLRRAP